MAKLQITYTKSAIGYSKDQKATIESLGLRKLNSTAIHDDTPSIRGMAFKVRHLVTVTEHADSEPQPAKASQTVVAAAPAPTTTKSDAPAADQAAVNRSDDLVRIEGIGPKIASVLKAAGISTFAELAATDVARLNEILQSANLRLADPTTWPEQAQLAAEDKWDDLKSLQDSLKGGQRV